MRLFGSGSRLAAGFAVLLAMTPGEAGAEEAAALLKKGIELFDGAEFEGSRAALERALNETRDGKLVARIHLYLGLNDAVTGNVARARGQFELALRHDPGLVLDSKAFKKDLVALFDQVRGAQRGGLEVTVAPAGAVVIVDGARRGAIPFRAELPIGAHRLEVRGPDGGTAFSGNVLLGPGRTTRIAVPLGAPRPSLTVSSRPAGAEVVLDGRLLGTTPLAKLSIDPGVHRLEVRLEGRPAEVRELKAAAGEQLSIEVRLEERVSRRQGWLLGRRWTWIALAAAACTFGAGIGVGVSAQRDFSGWDQSCRGSSDVACLDLRYSISDRDLAANVLYGVGGGLAITAAVLFFVERPARGSAPPREQQARRPRLRPLLGRALGGSLSLSF